MANFHWFWHLFPVLSLGLLMQLRVESHFLQQYLALGKFQIKAHLWKPWQLLFIRIPQIYSVSKSDRMTIQGIYLLLCLSVCIYGKKKYISGRVFILGSPFFDSSHYFVHTVFTLFYLLMEHTQKKTHNVLSFLNDYGWRKTVKSFPHQWAH